jgi:hypothetical protein
MYAVGSRVRLLAKISGFAAGTEAVVVSVIGHECEIEIDLGRRLVIDCDALAPAEAELGRADVRPATS